MRGPVSPSIHRTRRITPQMRREGCNSLKHNTMGIDIITLYRECPDAVVKVKVSDIIEANRSLITEAIEQYEQSRRELDMTELMTGQEVEALLGISRTTRERWSRPDAFGQPPLLPKIKVGWQVRYRRADVEQVKVKEDFKYGK